MRARSVMRSKRRDALLRRDGPPHILETATWAPWAGSLRRSIKTRASPGNVFRLVLYVVAINIWLLEFDGRSATGLSTTTSRVSDCNHFLVRVCSFGRLNKFSLKISPRGQSLILSISQY